MCTWMAGLFDAVIGLTGVLVCYQFVLSRVRPVLLFRVMDVNSTVYVLVLRVECFLTKLHIGLKV